MSPPFGSELKEYESSAAKFLVSGFFMVLGGAGLFIFLHSSLVSSRNGALLLAGAGVGFMLIALTAWPAGLRLSPGPPPSSSRRKRADEDSAVSPVIGVILMVAITVILAAVVFVLVSNLSKNTTENSPNLSFSQSGTTATTLSFQVVSQTSPADWTTCTVRDAAGAIRSFTVNGAAAAGKSTAGDVLAITGLTTKTNYQLLLVCNSSTVGTFAGTTA